MHRALVVTALLMGSLLLRTSPALAQARLRLLPTLAEARELSSSSGELAEQAQRDKLARRADFRVAIGAGLLAASVAHLAMFGRKGACYDDRLVTPWLTAPVFAIGGAVLIGTGIADAHTGRGSRQSRDIAQKVLASIGTSLLASGLMFGVVAREWIGCIQS
jgi:xanthine/uracil permease